MELGPSPREPPPVLYHGTATRFIDSILREGLKPQARLHVHLSIDLATAQRVGQRHSTATVLTVDAQHICTRRASSSSLQTTACGSLIGCPRSSCRRHQARTQNGHIDNSGFANTLIALIVLVEC